MKSSTYRAKCPVPGFVGTLWLLPFASAVIWGLLPGIASAQFEDKNFPQPVAGYSLPSSLPVQTRGLAASDLIPPIFLPFHKDWRIRTVAIPARAKRAPAGFVALDFDQSPRILGARNQTIDLAGPQLSYTLLSSSRERLFSFSIGGSRRTVSSQYFPVHELTESDTKFRNVDASVRYVAIRKVGTNTSVHRGIHASIGDALSKTVSLFHSTPTNSLSDETESDSLYRNRDIKRNDQVLSAGIEYGRSTSDMDIVVDATYHRTLRVESEDATTFSEQISRRDFVDPGDPDLIIRTRSVETERESTGRLNSVSATAFLRRQSDLENRSVFFVSNVILGFGGLDALATFDELDQLESFSDGVSIENDLRENESQSDVQKDSNSWLFRVGSGVELNHTYGALSVSGGLAVDIISSNQKMIPGGYRTYIETSPQREITASLPVVAFVEVYRDIFVFGGAIYRASYAYSKVTTAPEVDQSSANASTTNTTLQIDGSYPLGLMARHPSGFFLQAAFRGNLANYQTWRVTIGLDLDPR